MGVEIPHWKKRFWGLSHLLKIIGRLFCGVCSKRGHWILNNGMTARLLQPTAVLPTGLCYITLDPMKNTPHAMRRVVKLLCPFLTITTYGVYALYIMQKQINRLRRRNNLANCSLLQCWHITMSRNQTYVQGNYTKTITTCRQHLQQFWHGCCSQNTNNDNSVTTKRQWWKSQAKTRFWKWNNLKEGPEADKLVITLHQTSVRSGWTRAAFSIV